MAPLECELSKVCVCVCVYLGVCTSVYKHVLDVQKNIFLPATSSFQLSFTSLRSFLNI